MAMLQGRLDRVEVNSVFGSVRVCIHLCIVVVAVGVVVVVDVVVEAENKLRICVSHT